MGATPSKKSKSNTEAKEGPSEQAKCEQEVINGRKTKPKPKPLKPEAILIAKAKICPVAIY